VSMTEAHIIDLMPRLRARDRYEMDGVVREPLESWAAKRARDPGLAWSLIEDGMVLGVGGILDAGRATGALWLLFADGWERHIRLVLGAWKIILSHGIYDRLECKCYADNEVANRFAVKQGFTLEKVLPAFTIRGEDVNQYGMNP
jgi:hypothetical protein